MSEACGKLGGRGEIHTGFWWGKYEGQNHLEDLAVDGKTILKLSFKK